jgi:hypothetical protein
VLWASTAGPGHIYDYFRAVSQSQLGTEWHIRHIVTHRVGSTTTKVAVFARATVTFAVALVRSRPDVIHLHAVDKRGSRFRSAVLARMARLARVPVILQVHAMTRDGFDVDSEWRRLDGLYRDAAAGR